MKITTFLSFPLFVILLLAFSAVSAESASSVTQHGVTWTFDRNYTTGQYANGDGWVVGPVSIIGISPAPTVGRNGTTVNPALGSKQGYDNRLWANEYNDTLNVGNKLPTTVAANSSVVSTISKAATAQYGQIDVYTILTVVDSAPANGSFRPPYIGGGSRVSQWKVSDLDFSKLNSLSSAALTARPNIETVAGKFSKVWYEQDLNWTGRFLHASYMADNGYGKDMAVATGDAALLLQLDYTIAQKNSLLINIVQYGIDISGILSAGGQWYADGGHNPGRLSPLLIAAFVLNDANLKAMALGSTLNFQEYQQTFFVTQSDVNRTGQAGTNGDAVYPYVASNIGMPEWGIRHSGDPTKDNNFWLASYRDIGGSILTAPSMAAQAMGVRGAIGWEPMFQYAVRHVEYEQSASYKGEFAYNSTPSFHRQFYNAHKAAAPPSGTGGGGGVIVEPPPPAASFALGDRIQVSIDTNVRSAGTLTATKLGVQGATATGTIMGGPIGKDADNITWWQVDYDTGVDGWSGQDNFVQMAIQVPSKPEGLRIVK